MLLSEFEFELPADLIAQAPLEDRSDSRLLHVDCRGRIAHHRFVELIELVSEGDLLVANNTRVVPARLSAVVDSGALVELLVLPTASVPQSPATMGSGVRLLWVLAKPARKLRPGGRLRIQGEPGGEVLAEVVDAGDDGRRLIRVRLTRPLREWMQLVGKTPLPPYIAPSLSEERTRRRYQTVYAKHEGAIAAPTAGLHFTDDIIASLKRRGIGWEELTLHVGHGTFQPIRTERVEDHRMSVESYEISPRLVEQVARVRRRGGRVVAVGTTTVRALESAGRTGRLIAGVADTDLFITPGYKFQIVDGLVTNFHLPRSSLMILVCALAGQASMRRAYEAAVAARYRFYSYGDAMLIYPGQHGATDRQNCQNDKGACDADG